MQSGSRTLKDAMNEALRDWVTNVARHLLLHRHGRGPASLSGDGARLPVGDRRRDARADAGGRRPPARRAGRLRRRRLERDRPVPSRSSTTATSRSIGVEAAGHGIETRQARRLADRRPPRRAARQPHLSAAGRRRPDHRGAFDLRRPRLSRRRARSIPGCKDTGRVEYLSATDDEALDGVPAAARGSRASSRRSSPRMRSRKVIEARADAAEDHLLVVNLSGRGDKDMLHRRRASARQGARDHAHRPRFAAAAGGRPRRLVTFVTAGDPDLATSLAILEALPRPAPT